MSEGGISSAPPVFPVVSADSEGANPTEEQESSPPSRVLHCSGCIVWPRQQTWLCVVPLLIGFIGLGLSLMLLRWIVVGSVKEYVPPDQLESNRVGQDPIFLSKPSSVPRHPETTVYAAANPPVSTVSPSTRGTMSITPRLATQGTIHSTTALRSPSTPTPRPGGPLTSSAPGTSPYRLTSTATHGTPWQTVPYSTSSSKFFLHDSTPSWTLSKSGESTTDTHSVARPKFPTTTYTTERSEHFKPCTDKDLAYCLNEGECFIIETLTGNNKHCRCKEGYQGVRCDQYLPKTDSILSDPTEHLGIEFMESEDMYQRQIMSITCITIGLTVVGMLCVVLYFKTKKQRQKLRDQGKEIRFAKSYSLNTTEVSRPDSPRQNVLPLEKYTKPDNNIGEERRKVLESQFSAAGLSPAKSSPSQKSVGKPQRYCPSSSLSPRQLGRMSSKVSPRPSPPLLHSSKSSVGEGQASMSPSTNSQIQDQLSSANDSLDSKRAATTCRKSPESSRDVCPATSHRPVQLCTLELRDKGTSPQCWTASVPVTPLMGEKSCVQVQVESQECGCTEHGPHSYPADLMSVSAPNTPLHAAEGQQVEMLLQTVQRQIQILALASRKPEDYELINECEEAAGENTAFLPVASAEEVPFLLKKEQCRDCDLGK
ncbi:pro-neuregulin-3, membrane-bound isoform-like isoform X2 [Pristis pectinata]|uniref:pro-neuregulin-3, membrane-bound isoform-like isoform X2 n=1 Tax=Pristis pectinata TaxID=685728 RepID=UPI00223CCF18|nr:pro-neuregulin-3, membrane-bound isoform-like isoform X2 [Pristis pectinata]